MPNLVPAKLRILILCGLVFALNASGCGYNIGAPFNPAPEDIALVLSTYVLQKAFYELRDELEQNGDLIVIPLEAIIEIAAL